ncbi:MAG: alanine--tRNA ligase, partial [Deltaproteobacteria bacterium]|nr:alanine--tRNA ligase [Deltaproteobacteria bacterium]
VWNLVFMQWNRDAGGAMAQLARPSIDTGMGLERLAAVAQGVRSNYDIDLFAPIIAAIEAVTGKKYGSRFEVRGATADIAHRTSHIEQDIAIRVLADHIRATVMLIADGVQPANDGRGYVLRRIMRRAIRHGRLLGQSAPFFAGLAPVVVEEMGAAYPELANHQAFIAQVIRHEEERFFTTLENGLAILTEAFQTMQKSRGTVLPGELVFRLYDTYGFPKDLTADIAAEKGYAIDEDGFAAQMEGQRQKARAAWKGTGEEKTAPIYGALQRAGIATRFVGYEAHSHVGTIGAILKAGKRVSEANAGDTIEFVADVTPFYGEGGGQVGDVGLALGDGVELAITDTRKPYSHLYLHAARVVKGRVREGDVVTLAIDGDRRERIRRNHTATHLLHKALRSVLGDHVKQAGSLVAPERLRFDFAHFAPIASEDLHDIEADVNRVIRANIPLVIGEMPYPAAVAKGALAFFGDKYGDVVRVVEVPNYSIELCGGTHVRATGDIGVCKILAQAGVAAGVRRIEAITGATAVAYIQQLEAERAGMAQVLRVGPQELGQRVKKLAEQVKQLERELAAARGKAGADDLMARAQEVCGVRVLAARVEVASAADLRGLADQYRQKLGSGIVVLGAVANAKANLIVAVTKDLADRFPAGKLIGALATLVGGTGGGRADMAQGGGPDTAALASALASVPTILADR